MPIPAALFLVLLRGMIKSSFRRTAGTARLYQESSKRAMMSDLLQASGNILCNCFSGNAIFSANTNTANLPSADKAICCVPTDRKQRHQILNAEQQGCFLVLQNLFQRDHSLFDMSMIQNHMNALLDCSRSAWYLTLNARFPIRFMFT